jgi:hypothetical protein
VGGGGDADGDGVPDLAVGAIAFEDIAGDDVGAAWVVPGAWIAGRPTVAVVDDVVPAGFEDFAPVASRVVGAGDQSQFGKSVALVDSVFPGGRAALVVGAPLSSTAGTLLSGGAAIYQWLTAAEGGPGLDPVPAIAFCGESAAPDSRLGDVVAAGRADGRAVVVVGGFRSDAIGLDQGGVYVLNLD